MKFSKTGAALVLLHLFTVTLHCTITDHQNLWGRGPIHLLGGLGPFLGHMWGGPGPNGGLKPPPLVRGPQFLGNLWLLKGLCCHSLSCNWNSGDASFAAGCSIALFRWSSSKAPSFEFSSFSSKSLWNWGNFWNGILIFFNAGGIFSNGFERGGGSNAGAGDCGSFFSNSLELICMRFVLRSLWFVLPLLPPTNTLLLLKLWRRSFWFDCWFGYTPSEKYSETF